MLPNKVLIQRIYKCHSVFEVTLFWLCWHTEPFHSQAFHACFRWILGTNVMVFLLKSGGKAGHGSSGSRSIFFYVTWTKHFCNPQSSIRLLNLYRSVHMVERDKRHCSSSMGCTNSNRTGWALLCSLHSSIWKRRNTSCDRPGTTQLDRASTGF